MSFSSGNSGFSKIFQWKRKKYYITMEIIMIQLKNEPTRGKRGGDKRNKGAKHGAEPNQHAMRS